MPPLTTPPLSPRVIAIARLAQGGRWRTEAMRSASESCLLWFTRGQGRVTLNGVTRGYGAHNAVFVPAHVMHGFDIGQQTAGLAVFFGQDYADPLPKDPLHLRVRDTASQTELSALIDAAARELASDKPAAARAAQHWLGLISVWLERQAASQPNEMEANDGARRLVTRYSALIERDFRSGAGVAEYARALGVTATHLTRSCRATSGRSALDLLQDRRLYEARRLLSETQTPVREISAALGFGSAAYFTRAFHAKTGKTPSDFRRAG